MANGPRKQLKTRTLAHGSYLAKHLEDRASSIRSCDFLSIFSRFVIPSEYFHNMNLADSKHPSSSESNRTVTVMSLTALTLIKRVHYH